MHSEGALPRRPDPPIPIFSARGPPAVGDGGGGPADREEFSSPDNDPNNSIRPLHSDLVRGNKWSADALDFCLRSEIRSVNGLGDKV